MEYPEDQQAFDRLVSSEQTCREYLESIRWPEGFSCPACNHRHGWRIAGGLWECSRCGRQTSVTSGTLFQDTRYPLSVWFRAIWYVVAQKQGTSASGIQKILGLGSYHTAWSWLHRLRRAMVRPDRERLTGVVQVDETFHGAARPGKRGRGAANKAVILIAVEHRDRELGRIRLQHIDNASSDVLVPAVRDMIAEGSEIETDGWRGYNDLHRSGYRHQVIRTDNPDELLPQVHLIASLLKRWLLGTHQGAVRHTHLQYYLDEFTFRFNRQTSNSRGLLFRRLLENAVQIAPVRGTDLQASTE